MYQIDASCILGMDEHNGTRGERDEHARDGEGPMIRVGSLDDVKAQVSVEWPSPLLPRPRGTADNGSTAQPAA